MKKFTLLAFVLCLTGMSFGQMLRQGTPKPVKQDPVNFVFDHSSTKGSGDVFWSTTFNWGNVDTGVWELPAGWEIKDNTDFGNPWMWRSPYDTLGGCCTWQGPSSNFTTPLDGYLVVPADEYNRRDGVGSSNAMNTYIVTPPINCSGKATVVVKFKQLFRLCCAAADLKMYVTNDGGVHWAEYDCRFALSMNRVTDARYQDVEFNITDVAAGLPSVQIKFYMNGNTHYFWMIDDLRLSEAYQNDLVLADYWQDFNGGFDDRIGHINYWPLSQMGQASATGGNIGDYQFKGAFLNNGAADQENAKLQMTVLKNGDQVFQDVSAPSTIWTLERDTLTVNSVFLASDYGDYQFQFKGLSDNTEEVPVNNSVNKGFTVTDTLFHRADFTAESSSNTGGWVGGGNAGDMVGVFYDIFKPCEVNSISAYISGVTIAQIPQFQYVLLKDMGTDGLVEWILSDIIDATTAMRSTWQTLELIKDGETEFLEPGTYVACVRFWGTLAGDDTGTNGMSIGWDMDNNAGNYTYNLQSVGGGWFNTGKMNLIGVNINVTGGPTQAPVTFTVNMNKFIANGEFNPAVDLVEVNGLAPNFNTKVPMTDTDGDGIYTATVNNLPVSSTLNYKYSVNGKQEEYPMSGNLFRTYRVRYWNTLADLYNFERPVVLFNVDMKAEIAGGRFVPATDTLEVQGLGNSWMSMATLTDPDADGIYSVAAQNIRIGAILNYKYLINSKLENYPLTGDPFRKHTVKYWNTINDKYNAAGTSGLDPVDIETTVRVYPNPTSGAFRLNINSSVASDVFVKLTNIQGQVIYQNTLSNAVNYSEVIDCHLTKGLYFLSINNGKEIKIEKVVVQ